MSTTSIDVRDLPARFAEMLSLATNGTEVIVTLDSVPRARLTPVPLAPRVAGMHPGAIHTTEAFDAPLPADMLKGTS